MVSSMKIVDRVCQHLRALKFPSVEASRFASLVGKWLTCNGPEWTVERLKALKQCHLESLQSSGGYIPPTGWATRENSKSQRILKDGLLHRLISHTGFNLKQVEGFLRIYQVIILDRTSKKQLHKMKGAIETPPLLGVREFIDSISENLILRKVSLTHAKYVSKAGSNSKQLPDFLGSPKKRSPLIHIDIKGLTYVRSEKRSKAETADWRDLFSQTVEWNAFWKKYPKQVGHAFGVSNSAGVLTAFPKGSTDCKQVSDNLLGSVVILQGAGAKARWIANPLLCVQAIGEPLKNKLLAYSKAYPEIKTLDQDAGHQVVVDWLKSGQKVYSFDATSFTDRFPVDLQLIIAKKLYECGLIDQFDLDALEIVTKGSWWSTDLQRRIKWEAGQPLGYGPSFHLATLTHAIILDTIDVCCNGRETDCWQVVGDDVVINDRQVAIEYKEYMTSLGVEINLSKSLISPKYAEFLGKLLTLDGVNPSIKLKIFSTHSQVIDALAFYGWNGMKHLSTKERMEALDIFLPEHLGGQGWRIPGVPYGKLYLMMNQYNLSERVIRKDLRDFFGQPQDPSQSSYILQLRKEFYSRNSFGSPAMYANITVWSQEANKFLKKDFSYNDFTERCSASSPDEDKTSSEQQSISGTESFNTFMYLIDTMVRLENQTCKRLLPTEEEVRNGLRPKSQATSVLTTLGYVSNLEKPPSGQNSSNFKENNYDERTSKPTRGIFGSEFKLTVEQQFNESVKRIKQSAKQSQQWSSEIKRPKRNP